jgi:hypothetical protein
MCGERMRQQRSGLGQRIPTNPVQRSVVTDDDELEEDEEYYVTRPRTSARRYDLQPEQVIRQGNKNYTIHHGPPPPRRRQYFEEEGEQPTPRRRVHKLVYAGIALFAIIAIWQGLNGLAYVWQQKQDDWQFGKNRVYITDAVVGHNDSPQNPSHFIAVNDKGNIYVIELQGGDTGKAHIYNITTIEGNINNPPVVLFFQHLTRDGRVDMIVQIGDQGNAFDINLFNNGAEFVATVGK